MRTGAIASSLKPLDFSQLSYSTSKKFRATRSVTWRRSSLRYGRSCRSRGRAMSDTGAGCSMSTYKEFRRMSSSRGLAPSHLQFKFATLPSRPSPNGRQVDRKKIRRVELLRVKLNIEPLVSEEQFAEAQAILGQRRKSWISSRSEESRFEPSGLLYCRCGERMYSKGAGRCRRQKWLDVYYCRASTKADRVAVPCCWIRPLTSLTRNIVRACVSLWSW